MQKNPRVVYVGNLDEEVTEALIYENFVPFGDIRNIEIPKDPISQQSRGFAFVEFDEENDAAHAIFNKHNAIIRDRAIVVEPSRPTRPKELLNKPIWADEDYYQKYYNSEQPSKHLA
jgi:peptidyl-prolyl isomerase E (cyclophilin E)